MKIADNAKYIRIPKTAGEKCAQLFIYIEDTLSRVFSLSPENEEGYYYYPVHSCKGHVSLQCSDETIFDSIALII